MSFRASLRSKYTSVLNISPFFLSYFQILSFYIFICTPIYMFVSFIDVITNVCSLAKFQTQYINKSFCKCFNTSSEQSHSHRHHFLYIYKGNVLTSNWTHIINPKNKTRTREQKRNTIE